jgi:hypothetical protein
MLRTQAYPTGSFLSYRVQDGTFEVQIRFYAIIARMKNCVDRFVIEFEAKKGKLRLTDMNKWKKFRVDENV